MESRPIRALLLGQSLARVEPLQLDPFARNRRLLRDKLGLTFERVETATFADKAAALAARHCDVAFVQTSWKESPEATMAFFRDQHARPARPKIVYLDSFDSSASPFFGILPFVDVYVKKQMLRELDDYRSDLAGGYAFTDFLANTQNLDLHGWTFGSPLPASGREKLVLGWNVGVADRFADPLLHIGPARLKWLPLPIRRDIDVSCRVSLGSAAEGEPGDWYRLHRRTAVEQVRTLAPEFKVVGEGYGKGPAGKVPPWRYRLELRRSKLCLSPFGYGEVCYRDFEAALAGCLLVKPGMGHLRTAPDLYEDGETYAAVKWELSDLPDVCRHYLRNPQERRRIVRAARERYVRYFRDRAFLDALYLILTTAGARQGSGGGA